MTVSDLIALLADYDPAAEVVCETPDGQACPVVALDVDGAGSAVLATG